MLLTIAVPTLNGERFLAEAVTSAALQIRDPDAVEVLIVDNASSDGTRDLSKTLSEKFPCVRVVRNDRMVEINRNIEVAIGEAVGDYVWILADDDVIVDGGLEEVLTVLKRQTPALVLVGSVSVDEDLRSFADFASIDPDLRVFDVSGRPAAAEKNERGAAVVFDDAESALSGTGFSVFGLLSSIVVKRRLYEDELRRLGEPIPSGFDFLYLIPMVMRRRRTVFLPGPWILFRQYAKRWVTKDDYSQAFDNYFVVIRHVLHRLERQGFERRATRPILRGHLMMLTLHTWIAKSKGMVLDWDLIERMIKVNSRHLLFWIQLPVVAPRWALKPVPRCYRAARSAAAGVGVRG